MSLGIFPAVSLKIIDVQQRAVDAHACREAIGRRVRQGESGQVKHVGEIVARHLELDRRRAEIEGLRDRDAGVQRDVGSGQMRREGIGCVRIQVEQRSAVDLEMERFRIERSGAPHLKRGGVGGAGSIGRHQRPAEGQLADLIDDVHLAILHEQAADGRNPGRLLVTCGPAARRPEFPTGTTSGIALQVDGGFDEIDLRKDEPAAQQIGQTHTDGEPAGAEHQFAVGPGWILQLDVVDVGTRIPGP